MNLERKCGTCMSENPANIKRVDSAQRGYYITYICGHRDFVSDASLKIKEEMGIGSMTKEDYKRINNLNDNKEVKS